MRKKILCAIIMTALAAGMLCGCGKVDDEPRTTAGTTEDLPPREETVATAGNAQASPTEATESKPATPQEAAEKKVLATVGKEYEVVSSEAITGEETTDVYRIGVRIAGTKETPIWYYYASKDFCKTESQWLSDKNTPDEGGQNPMMNFIGDYTNGKDQMHIECDGSTGARVIVTGGDGTKGGTEWTMSGESVEEDDTFVIKYSNCMQKNYEYADNGSINTQTIVYENGTGTITIKKSDSKVTWKDDTYDASDEKEFHAVE